MSNEPHVWGSRPRTTMSPCSRGGGGGGVTDQLFEQVYGSEYKCLLCRSFFVICKTGIMVRASLMHFLWWVGNKMYPVSLAQSWELINNNYNDSNNNISHINWIDYISFNFLLEYSLFRPANALVCFLFFFCHLFYSIFSQFKNTYFNIMADFTISQINIVLHYL